MIVTNKEGLTQADVDMILGDPDAELKRLRAALTEIATGDGVYGAQAHEYKQIARRALGQMNEGKE